MPLVMRTTGEDLLVGIAEVLLELRRVVAGEALYAAVNNFRWVCTRCQCCCVP